MTITNKPMVSVELQLTEQHECDLIRLHETCEDSQPYDVSKEGMKSLARLGLARSLGFSRYELTDSGYAAGQNLLGLLSRPAAHHQGEPVAKAKPVAKLHAERLTVRDGEYGITGYQRQWLKARNWVFIESRGGRPLVGRMFARMKLGIISPSLARPTPPPATPAWTPDFSRVN